MTFPVPPQAPAPPVKSRARGSWSMVAAGLAGALITLLALFGPGLRAGLEQAGDPSSVLSAASRWTFEQRSKEVQTVLDRRAEAMVAKDEAAWLADVDPTIPNAVTSQKAQFTYAKDIPFVAFTYRVNGTPTPLSAERLAQWGVSEGLVVQVVLEYSLAEVDGAKVRREKSLTFVKRDKTWRIGGQGEGSSSVDLWEQGPVRVINGTRSLVLTTGPLATAQKVGRDSDQAAATVDQVWGQQWPRKVAVWVPANEEAMGAVLGRGKGAGLEQVAAVTTGEVVQDSAQAVANRIVINPGAFEGLKQVGRTVVLTHELTHVATRSETAGQVPMWLSEGFADFVAYRNTGFSERAIAHDTMDVVKQSGPPPTLPTKADFDPQHNPQISTAYAQSWVALNAIERKFGAPAVVNLYRSMASKEAASEQERLSVDTQVCNSACTASVQEVLGIDLPTLVGMWQQRLVQLAR